MFIVITQDALHVIVAGKLHIVTAAASDRPLRLAVLGPGDSMGEINLFDPGSASASAIARGSAVVWSLSRSELDSFLDADPLTGVTVLRALLGQLSQRIRVRKIINPAPSGGRATSVDVPEVALLFLHGGDIGRGFFGALLTVLLNELMQRRIDVLGHARSVTTDVKGSPVLQP